MILNVILALLAVLIWIIYLRNFNIEGFATGSDTASATAVLSNGKIDYIDIITKGNYKIPPVIDFIGKSSRKAKALGIVDNNQLVGILILDSGEGYKEPPKIKFIPQESSAVASPSGEINDRYSEIMLQLGNIKKELGDKNEAGKNLALTNAITMASGNSNSPVTLAGLSQEQIDQYAKEYTEIEEENNKMQSSKIASAKEKLVSIIEYQKKEKIANEYSRKHNLPPPPEMYSKAEIEQAKKDAQGSSFKNLNTNDKALCMLYLNDYNAKNEKMKDLGNMAREQPYLLVEVKKASEIANEAHNLYRKKCL